MNIVEPKRLSGKHQNSNHKRAKSDAVQQFVLM